MRSREILLFQIKMQVPNGDQCQAGEDKDERPTQVLRKILRGYLKNVRKKIEIPFSGL
jgi:hypothetical protein